MITSKDNKQMNVHEGKKGPKGSKRSKKDKTAKNNNHMSESPTTQQETDLFGIGAQFWD
jgi:hypothetical protein